MTAEDRPQLVDAGRGPTASQAAGLTLAAARGVVAAVLAEAATMGVPLSVAVVDAGDQLVAFER
ncbi:MAG TPA: heme-binding protein, partial [Candidatus Limnocylindria bacterium]|nr:heme-binding protein [Candidatus Limnocylindria bacterium]